MNQLLLFICLSVLSLSVFSQNDYTLGNIENAKKDSVPYFDPNQHPGKIFNTWSVSAQFGAMIFYGDVSNYEWVPSNSKDIKTGFGFSVSKSFTPTFTLRGNMLFGNLRSNDTVNYFTSKVIQQTLMGDFNLSNMLSPNKKDRKLAIYGIAGLGLIYYRTILKNIKTDAFVSSEGYKNNGQTKKSPTIEVIVPIGLGLKYKITHNIDVFLETTLNHVNSDHLDALKVAGTPKDKFGYTNVGLTYHFGKKEKSLNWVTPFEVLMYDQDKDGVPDYMDSQPNSIPNAPVDVHGVALDSDGDGIPDIDDMEPNTPKGAKVNSLGVAIDSDKDGVPDIRDKEPNTPKGMLVNFQGITIGAKSTTEPDDDGDGVPNSIDREPNTPRGVPVDAFGVAIKSACAISDSTFSMSFPSVYFEVNSAKVDQANFERIAPIAKLLQYRKDISIEVIGYADRTGDAASNRELSKKRAETVLDILNKKYGISKDRLFINFFGDTRLLSTDVNSPVNRRVDFMITKQ